MSENQTAGSFLRKMVPRVAKAAVKGLIYFALLYLVPTLLISQVSGVAPQLTSGLGRILDVFIIVIVVFVVASELTSGTIFQHALNVGKAIILMVFFVVALDGGVLNLDIESIHLVADLRIVLVTLIVIDLIGLARNLLQAINFLSEKAEQQLPTPKPAG